MWNSKKRWPEGGAVDRRADELSTEVVDHIDGDTAHNDLENLRLFASNGEHLATTLAGRAPRRGA